MLRMPKNMTLTDTSLTDLLIKSGVFPGVTLMYGYGPSTGVDDQTKEALWEGGRIDSPTTDLSLIGKVCHGSTGPWVSHYSYLYVWVDGFEDNQDGLTEYLYKNRFRFDLPGEVLAFVEKRQKNLDGKRAVCDFALEAGFVYDEATPGQARAWRHRDFGLTLEVSPMRDSIVGMWRGSSCINRSHPLVSHFLKTGEILTDLLGEKGGFLKRLDDLNLRSKTERERVETFASVTYNGEKYYDVYGRWGEIRKA